jgi:hypothetical protein
MDPTECLRDILAAITCNDRDTVYESTRDLLEWLRKGGALPQVELLTNMQQLTATDAICVVV